METLARVPARIHPTAFVAAGAVVVGDVTLSARASVWFNSVVRGDSASVEIGEGSNVQDNSVVHVDEGMPAVLGARVTVGHRAIIHGCVIEDDCLIGMGSVVLSGARIGRGSLIGAASLVREGQQIPAGSLAFGSPARVVGPVGPAHKEAIRNGAAHYAELANVYRSMGLGQPADRSGAQARDPSPMSAREWRELVDRLEAIEALLRGSRK
jgi:carbonic anhydrase/acetyltransferase-like protein (isoleucine patch superfamily)